MAATTILIASTRRYSGKTGVASALVDAAESRGLDVGYFKPYGGMPVELDGVLTDRDAAFINRYLRRPAADADVCPVVRTRRYVEGLLEGEPVPGPAEVTASFARVAAGRDLVVVETPSDLDQGAAAGLSCSRILDLLGGTVVLVEQAEPHDPPDRILGAAATFGVRLTGVIHNRVAESDLDVVRQRMVPFLEQRGVRTFGVLPFDPTLSSVTVAEIADTLGGRLLCGGATTDRLVQSFMVGAMGQEKALRFFRRKSHKAVVTGGDRADVQMSALETSTEVLVLTGNMPPSPPVLARADELGVCVVVVDMDTLTAVEQLDTLFGHVRLHGPGKAARMREVFALGVDVDVLLASVGLR